MLIHHNKKTFLFIVLFSLGLFSCSGQSVKPDTVKPKKVDLLVQSAKIMAAERDLAIWKVQENGVKYDIDEAKNYKDVTLVTMPQAVGSRLCKAKQYQFKAFRIARGYKWKPVDGSDDGFVSIFSNVVDGANQAICSQSSFTDFFDTPDSIENNTLIALYTSLRDQIRSGSIRSINKNDFNISSISLFENTGFGSDGYNAIINTQIPQSTYGVHMRYNAGQFSIVKVTLIN